MRAGAKGHVLMHCRTLDEIVVDLAAECAGEVDVDAEVIKECIFKLARAAQVIRIEVEDAEVTSSGAGEREVRQ